jgi:hypothetical protein
MSGLLETIKSISVASMFPDKIFIDNGSGGGFCCGRIYNFSSCGYKGPVYDLQVEEDHSFSGPHLTIHNCGAGQINVCLAERGMSLDEFSVARAGDYIDINASKMTGEPRTSVLRAKEKKLNFLKLDENDPVVLALDCYYDEMLRYVFGFFAKRFANRRGSIEHPIDLVLSGGTACVPGFDKKVRSIISKMDLPFEIAEIRLAGGGDKVKMLQAVANGCYLRAKQAAKKMANAKDVIEKAS